MFRFFLEGRKLGIAHPLGELFCPLVCPLFKNLGIAFSLSLCRRCGVTMFGLGRINMGKSHSLGQLFSPLVLASFLNLGIASALSLLGRSWMLWFDLGG